MVFFQLCLGLTAGLTIPHLVKYEVYMAIANSFLRPHLRFQIERERLGKDKAITTDILDLYVKDVIGSFMLFFIGVGPLIYKTYIKDQVAEEQKEMMSDKYAEMLKKIKQRETQEEEKRKQTLQMKEEIKEGKMTEKDIDQIIKNKGEMSEQKITFEDYENFMMKLEKDNKLELFEQTNPKFYGNQKEQENQIK